MKAVDLAPPQVVRKIGAWIQEVETKGIEETRKRPGFHDEPFKGPRAGQRSVRLSRAYRLIYAEYRGDALVILRVLEVTRHAY